MATKKPDRPKLSVEQALKNLMSVTQMYLNAAEDHYNADFFADREAAEAANKKAETAYSELQLCMTDARRALNDQL